MMISTVMGSWTTSLRMEDVHSSERESQGTLVRNRVYVVPRNSQVASPPPPRGYLANTRCSTLPSVAPEEGEEKKEKE